MATLWGNTILRSDTDRVRKEDSVNIKVKTAYEYYKALDYPIGTINYFSYKDEQKTSLDWRCCCYSRDELYTKLCIISEEKDFFDFCIK